MDRKHLTRREVLQKAVYVTPVILTLAATPSFAGKGSSGGYKEKQYKEKKQKEKKQKEKKQKP